MLLQVLICAILKNPITVGFLGLARILQSGANKYYELILKYQERGGVMSILTSDSFLITWSMSLGVVCFLLKFITSGANLIICDIGICLGVWGSASAFITRWKQMRPHYDIRRCEMFANIVVFVSVPCILMFRYMIFAKLF